MTKKKLWVIAGVIGAASIGAVPALTAQAYPPGKNLAVGAVGDTNGVYTVTIKNLKPGCHYEVESRGVEAHGTFFGPAGTDVTETLNVGTKPGTYVFTAHTKGCAPAENATFKIQVTHAQVSGPGSVKTGDKVTLRGTGWSTDSPVKFTLSNGKGTTITSPAEVVESDGDVHYEFKAPAAGIWAVVATQQGTGSATFTLNVGDKVKSAPKPKPHHKPKPKPKHHKKPTHTTPKPKPKGH